MTNIPIGLIGLFIMVPMILNLIVTAVIAHKYVEIIEEQLPNCSSVQTIREAWSGGGLLGKVMRGGVISIVLMVPKLSARRGVIDAKEVEKLPAFYKKILIIPTVVNFCLFTAMMALSISLVRISAR
ncbi:hypothetical protein RYA05_28335 [Pseudomonas syringae pv. actinidiae]|uniref:MFS family permease n=1 Tax=Pseudomonas syringae pv. actinidiae TaxID=103796 RepID=A0AAN4Q0Y7_PSESF|nr:hypothetical protein [Pseudomonas syringae]EPN55324.1 hypothetical protein A235_37636 [Pseudomonas syringae pv. actinidiae ICMP 19079]EPN86601.1 hypothetical protein A234_00930 [Pseudomonas syringae pv. actinidiae ICMP 19101]AKT28768.1 hypothetical protein IYO_004465 [Pseudomonas syringae pv. actinidiae ICMP 18884]AOE55293.1 hypothetical protein NZ708_04460 [Pseudomonas syringae pv. actinidiae ICMP 18708]APP96154.1 hypothetical protein PsaNZ45_04460 [Pseudomonas syringae pv. actinidiae]